MSVVLQPKCEMDTTIFGRELNMRVFFVIGLLLSPPCFEVTEVLDVVRSFFELADFEQILLELQNVAEVTLDIQKFEEFIKLFG